MFIYIFFLLLFPPSAMFIDVFDICHKKSWIIHACTWWQNNCLLLKWSWLIDHHFYMIVTPLINTFSGLARILMSYFIHWYSEFLWVLDIMKKIGYSDMKWVSCLKMTDRWRSGSRSYHNFDRSFFWSSRIDQSSKIT